MSRFKKKKSGAMPPISTASLPDIIFMLLFFFMVTTVMKESTLNVKVLLPLASEIQKLENKSAIGYIYVGKPRDAKVWGTDTRIQLNDAFKEVADVGEFVALKKSELIERDKQKFTTSLKVDMKSKMGIVTDIKQELRKAGAFKINYSSRPKAK